MRAALPYAVAALVLGQALTACTGSDPDRTSAPAAPSTPLASYDTAGVGLVRDGFCERIPDAAVRDVLGAEADRTSAYGNGDRVRLVGERDVAHEFGCAWTADDGTTARAWLFAPPVTRAHSRDLIEQARGEEGCRTDEQAPRFGDTSVALLCPAPGGTEASYRGLFVDSWLACSVTDQGADDDLLQRAGRWCVQVVAATRADG